MAVVVPEGHIEIEKTHSLGKFPSHRFAIFVCLFEDRFLDLHFLTRQWVQVCSLERVLQIKLKNV